MMDRKQDLGFLAVGPEQQCSELGGAPLQNVPNRVILWGSKTALSKLITN